jgi:hypothetical protein
MVTLTHTGAATDPAVMIQSATITGTDAGQFSHDLTSAPIYVFPGDTVDVDLSFTPTSVSGKTATFEVTHNGTASPLKLP